MGLKAIGMIALFALSSAHAEGKNESACYLGKVTHFKSEKQWPVSQWAKPRDHTKLAHKDTWQEANGICNEAFTKVSAGGLFKGSIKNDGPIFFGPPKFGNDEFRLYCKITFDPATTHSIGRYMCEEPLESLRTVCLTLGSPNSCTVWASETEKSKAYLQRYEKSELGTPHIHSDTVTSPATH